MNDAAAGQPTRLWIERNVEMVRSPASKIRNIRGTIIRLMTSVALPVLVESERSV
jgi:hypothetical protein